jgi:hypothetical protein
MIITKHRADRVMLYNIGWQQFENLLQDLGENRAARVAYYVEFEKSLVFPSLEIRDLPQIIEQNRANGRRAIRKAVREWVRSKK